MTAESASAAPPDRRVMRSEIALAARFNNRIQLVLPVGWKRPPGFPRYELLCVNAWQQRVVSVSARRLDEYLKGIEDELAASGS